MQQTNIDTVTAKRRATRCLERCYESAREDEFHFVVYEAGQAMETLGLDVERGRQLQEEGLRGVRSACAGQSLEGLAEKLPKLVTLIGRVRV